MRKMFSGSMITVAIAGAVGVISLSVVEMHAQGPTASGSATAASALKTPWGEPDLQGIWTDENDTPLQRSAKYANQEFFTPAQRAELDEARTAVLVNADKSRAQGTSRDVAGAYNSQFVSFKRTGARTSLIVDPPDGRIPPLMPAAQRMAAIEREFRLALLRATDTCRDKQPACSGEKYDPIPAPQFAAAPPRYNVIAINRHDGPEDGNLANRCLTGGLPEFESRTGSYRRIVQTPGGISIFYDVGQGQGWQRNIVMDGSSHLPANIRQWYGDSRGHWEGNTLVVDVTNFSAKTDFQGSRENLHLVERFTRTAPQTLQYEVTVEDPTVCRQSEQENRIYTEPRCVEENFSLPGLVHGRRVEELAFSEGRGPDPRTRDEQDPLIRS